MRKNIRRISPAHPEVALIPRRFKKGEKVYAYWVARWRDPDTEKSVEFKLDATVFPSKEARREWAIKKSKSLAKRKAELVSGAPKIAHTDLSEAVEAFLGSITKPTTVSTYRKGLDRLTVWANETGIRNIEKISPADLKAFNIFMTKRRKRVAVRHGKQGERRTSSEPLSPYSINRDIRSVKVAINHWRTLGKLPLVSRDDVTSALKVLSTSRARPAYLSPAECRRLLEATIRHDAETFSETRDEHAGLRPIGTTRRYDPVGPFILLLLLTGCRVGEGLGLRWSDIDFDALDMESRTVGEIHLKAFQTKTKRDRTIGLEVCPSLRSLLAALKIKSGGGSYVFGKKASLLYTRVNAARKRLIATYGAPRFTWQNLRQTTGTFLTNAPGIYGAASVFMSARQLGHSVTVAERHYLGVVRGIPREARTLEAAMRIEKLANEIVKVATDPSALAVAVLE